MNSSERRKGGTAMSQYMIETNDLTKKYGEQSGVFGASLHIKPGRIYGLLGRNGAGKTTIMRMLLGLTAPTSGQIRIFGKPLSGNETRILPHVGSLIESPGFYPNLTGTENLRIFARLRQIKNPEAIREALALVNLPYKDKKLFSQYSLGMKQRLAIALAVMHDPDLLILDEPINGLDPIGIAEVRDFIRKLCRERGKTIMISSHILSEIALLADDIGIIDHGRLLEEESLEELERKNSRYIYLEVSEPERAGNLLAERLALPAADYEADGVNGLHIYNMQVQIQDILPVLVQNGLSVSCAKICEDTLEDYFKKVTGGEGIA